MEFPDSGNTSGDPDPGRKGSKEYGRKEELTNLCRT